MPRFSIIIPAYNIELYLNDCLSSVHSQSFKDWEAIVVDDGSTDSTPQQADKWAQKDTRFHVIHQPNRGLSAARNTGIENAKGEYLLFLDSDDWLETNALQVVAGAITNEDIITYAGRRFFQESQQLEKIIPPPQKDFSSGMDCFAEHALRVRPYPFICVGLHACKKEIFEKYNLRFKEGLYHEDNLFTPMLYYYAGKVKLISVCLYNYRVRQGSIMTTASIKHCTDKLKVANTLAEFFIPKTEIDKTVVYCYITHLYQIAFVESPDKEADAKLLQLIDWKSYYRVSRTKLRHRVQYLALRISPNCFRNTIKLIVSIAPKH